MIFERHLAAFGYKKMETPVIQPAELFLTLAGDQIVNRLFTFEHRAQHFALRPEFTATAAAVYACEQANSRGPIRWQFGGYVFSDSSEIGKLGQAMSVGAELFGMPGPLADAEVVAAAALGLSEYGLNDFRIMMGHVQLLRSVLSQFGLDPRSQRLLLANLHVLQSSDHGKERAIDLVDRLIGSQAMLFEVTDGEDIEADLSYLLDRMLQATQRNTAMGGRTRDDITRRLLQKRRRAVEREQYIRAIDLLAELLSLRSQTVSVFDEIAQMLTRVAPDAIAILDQWRHTVNLIVEHGVDEARIAITPVLARDWDYYSGMIFELRAQDGGKLGGGGRYDDLPRLLGGMPNSAAVGFAYYLTPIVSALPYPVITNDEGWRLLYQAGAEREAIRWSQILRMHGQTIELIDHADLESTHERILIINTDGTLNVGTERFTIAEVEAVIAALRRD
ncbi:MAG: ATP phosphoribosyltransferase regulatory subunit [Aggregatilineales bacterium]